jgi:hypothetical protein
MVMAQGVYHIFNTAKMRILEVANAQFPNTVSCKEIARITGMEKGKVSRLLSYYHHHQYGYLRRMKKRDADGSFKYKINKKGVKAYLSFVLRVKQGFDLNLKRKTPMEIAPREVRRKPRIKSDKDLILTPAEIAPYIKVSYRGEYELGVKPDDALKIVGIVKDKPEEPEELVELEEPKEPVKQIVQQIIPSKIYTTKSAEQLSSQKMAEMLEEAIERIHLKLGKTTDTKKIKKLRDRLHSIKLWLAQHPDVKQYFNELPHITEGKQPTIGDVIEAMKIDIIKIREQIRVSTNQQEIDELKGLMAQYHLWIEAHKDMPRDSFVDLT